MEENTTCSTGSVTRTGGLGRVNNQRKAGE